MVYLIQGQPGSELARLVERLWQVGTAKSIPQGEF